MVYESDFYTTRRPYTRPYSSSYTVTDSVLRPISPIVRPSSPSVRSISPTTQVRRIPHLLPYIAHKRLVTVVHTPIHSYYYPGTPLPIRIHSRVRPSVLAAELQRIRDLPRSSHESYSSNYLNSKDYVLWDDETREIRARADALLRRIHVFVPRPVASDFAEDIVPERMHSDDYIRRLIGARKNAKKDEEPGSYYESPEQRHFGTGNLACVAYTGGKPHSRRRPYYKLADLRPADVQSDVNMLSYYAKNRQAAASAYPDVPMSEREIRKARALEDDEPPRAKRATRNEPEVEAIVEEEVLSFRPKRVPITEPEPEVKAAEPEVVIDEKPVIIESEPELIEEPEPQVLQSEPEAIAEPEPEVIAEPEPEVIAEPEPKVIAEPEPEVIADPEPEVIAEPEPEVVLEPEVEPTVETIEEMAAESEPEAIIEPEVVSEPEVQSPLEAEPEAIPQEDSAEGQESELIVESEAETIAERETEVTAEPQVQEFETSEPEATVEAPTDEQRMVNEDNIVTNNEDEAVDDDVLQRKLDEDDLRRQVEELKRQAEAEERRRVEEARLAEERWKEQEEERQKREREAAKRRMAEIEEQERLEAERKTEEERWEAKRIRDAKLAEIEKRAAEFDALLANEEENRYAIEKATEEARKRQEREERLAAEVILGTSEDLHHPDGSHNECQCHPEVNWQEIEERPESPDVEDDTQIEEQECGGDTDHDDASDPFVVEHEGFNSAPAEVVDAIDDGPVVEESSSNVDDFWGDNDD